MDPADLRGLPTLTVLPPWGSSIARWGKPWENRPMPPPRSIRGRPLEARIAADSEPEWVVSNGKPLGVRKWQAGAIPGTYPLPAEMFA